MSVLGRGLFKRRRPPAQDEPAPDPAVGTWAAVAADVADGLRPLGAFAVTMLGESLCREWRSPWFGHEPTGDDLRELLAALGEPQDGLHDLLAAEQAMAATNRWRVPSNVRAEWTRRLADTAAAARAEGLPERTADHQEAEEAWSAAARQIAAWRSTQLHPAAALSQLRWFPGCQTRTHTGYDDPLGLGHAGRSISEHRFDPVEWEGIKSANLLAHTKVDPLGWRLSCLAYAADNEPWTTPRDALVQ